MRGIQDDIKDLDGLIAALGEALGGGGDGNDFPRLRAGRAALVLVAQAEERLAQLTAEADAAGAARSEARAEEQEIRHRTAAQAAAQAEAEREHVEKTAWRNAEAKLVEQRLARAKAGLEELQGHVYVSDPKAARRKWDIESYVASEAGQLDAAMAAKDPTRDPQSRGNEARERTRQAWLNIAAFCIETVAEWQEAKAITAQRTADAIASNAAAVASTTAGRR